MATTTYVPLATVTASGSSSTQLVMSSIPSTYTDLVLVVSGASTSTTNNMDITFNGDTTSGLYNRTYMSGYGTGVEGNSAVSQNSIRLTANGIVSTTQGTYIYFINNYANTVTGKTIVGRSNNTTYGTDMVIGLWNSASAINRIDLSLTSSNFSSSTVFTLYGISDAGDDSPKANGGDVYSDSSYWYHVFPMSANFIPNQSLTADILCIAGGGGGGGENTGNSGGGGGAGGVVYLSSQSLTATNYSVVVGGGGRGTPSGTARGSNGTNSQFASLTAAIGGGGGGTQNGGETSGANGGSGGGGTYFGGSGGTGSQGGNGGSGSTTDGGSGGGGGAGGNGGNGNSTGPYYSGDGGIGTSTYSSWGLATTTGENISGTVYYAGGGGGGTNNGYTKPGGYGGGGGNGIYGSVISRAGLPNTGGGGGGSGINSTNGGSGIVIVRYAK